MYDPKQNHQELHTSERTIVPRTVIFIYIFMHMHNFRKSNFYDSSM